MMNFVVKWRVLKNETGKFCKRHQSWLHSRQVIWLQPSLFCVGILHFGHRFEQSSISHNEALSAFRWSFSYCLQEVPGCAEAWKKQYLPRTTLVYNYVEHNYVA